MRNRYNLYFLYFMTWYFTYFVTILRIKRSSLKCWMVKAIPRILISKHVYIILCSRRVCRNIIFYSKCYSLDGGKRSFVRKSSPVFEKSMLEMSWVRKCIIIVIIIITPNVLTVFVVCIKSVSTCHYI